MVLVFGVSNTTFLSDGASPKAQASGKGEGKDKIAAKKEPSVVLRRTPDGGIQPQAAMVKGVLHLIYFKGDPGHGDVFYVRSKDGGDTFSKPIRVNSHPQSVIAIGNVRGAHLAVNEFGRAHVAWMGSSKAEPKAPGGGSAMLYTRLNDEGTAFEPQRNLITAAEGLDGGGSLAVDSRNVYVVWHAPAPGKKGEDNRHVWLAISADEGKTFAKEQPINRPETGVCGCCGIRVFCPYPGPPVVLYRAATDEVHRDLYLLHKPLAGDKFGSAKLHPWNIGACPMSTMALADMFNEYLAAWDTKGQVYYTRVKHLSGEAAPPIAAPGKANQRKHPTLRFNGRQVLFAWTEGMGWNRGGALAWQVYDHDGRPVAGAAGRADGVPTWSLISAVAHNEQFVIFY